MSAKEVMFLVPLLCLSVSIPFICLFVCLPIESVSRKKRMDRFFYELFFMNRLHPKPHVIQCWKISGLFVSLIMLLACFSPKSVNRPWSKRYMTQVCQIRRWIQTFSQGI